MIHLQCQHPPRLCSALPLPPAVPHSVLHRLNLLLIVTLESSIAGICYPVTLPTEHSVNLEGGEGGLPEQPVTYKVVILCKQYLTSFAGSTQGPPMGDGLCGERVARTPMRCPFSRGTCTLAFAPLAARSGDQRRCRSVLQWKMYRTHTCEYCSNPSRQPMGMSGLQKSCASGEESPNVCCIMWDLTNA